MNLVYLYNGKSRDLRRIIVAILKSGTAKTIQKMNYIQSFLVNDKKIEKIDTKMLIITTDDDQKLTDFLSKNFSQLERVHLD